MSIFEIIERNNLTALKEVIKNKSIDLNWQNIDGDTALIRAALKGNTGCLKALVEAGADLNAQDERGFTALVRASYKGHTECLETLIKAGADLNAQDKYGDTALMWGTNWGRTECVKALIEAGADINIQNNDGKTALTAHNNKECAYILTKALSNQKNAQTASVSEAFSQRAKIQAEAFKQSSGQKKLTLKTRKASKK